MFETDDDCRCNSVYKLLSWFSQSRNRLGCLHRIFRQREAYTLHLADMWPC